MTDTLAVIALDAADLALLERWDCENVLLEQHHELETETWSRDIPLTTEVWPTVATGLEPSAHGIIATGEQQSWGNPLLDAVSSVTSRLLTDRMRMHAGELVRKVRGDGVDMHLERVDAPHPFDEDGVFGWPGLTDAEHLLEAWRWLELVKQGDLDEREAQRRLFANAGIEVGWLLGLAQHGYPVLGVHMHILDAAGHMYAESESDLRAVYERVDALLRHVRESFDNILILSDHGIQVSWLDDEVVGSHSMRAVVATTVDAELPASIYGVKEWIETHCGDDYRDESTLDEMPTTKEQLRDLGYIN